MNRYPVIGIAGAGCAGLSMACKLILNKIPFEKIFLIDNNFNKGNDRTWCFWKKKNEHLWCEDAIEHRWDSMELVFNDSTLHFNPRYWEYAHISGKKFYDFCFDILKKNTNVIFIQDNVTDFKKNHHTKVIQGKKDSYAADLIFNSALRHPSDSKKDVKFYQQFLGYFIKCSNDFHQTSVRWMDFSIEQPGFPAFIYILPFGGNHLLVEYTVFTPSLLEKTWFEQRLNDYIKQKMQILNFEIKADEFADIPMFSGKWKNPWPDIVTNIGIAGGGIKSSTGFAFSFIQKQTDDMIDHLNERKNVKENIFHSRFQLYDRMLLKLFSKDGNCAPAFFKKLFEKNDFENLISFLNNESRFWEEFKIMNSVKKWFI